VDAQRHNRFWLVIVLVLIVLIAMCAEL